MVLKKFENDSARWAETGDKSSVPSELSLAKIATGFVSGENADIPTIEDYNLLFNRLDKQVDTIVQEGPGSWDPDSTDANLAISTGLWDDSWSVTSETSNTISGGATKEYRDLCTFFTSTNEPRLLVLDNANTKIEVWDPRAKTLSDTSDALTDDLPSGGTETWETVSMCTDGTYVYATFTDTDATPDEHRIQAWTISDWSIRSGWPLTGTALSGTGNGIGSYNRDSKVIIADSTHIAVACGWTVISAIGDPAIQLFLRSDGSAVRDGAGDAPPGVSAQVSDAICSDGTNIFFGATNSALTNKYVCSATIADLTAGCGGTGYPLTQVGAEAHKMIACGPSMIISAFREDSGVQTDQVLRTHDSGGVDLDIFIKGIDSQAAVGDEYLTAFPLDMVFDGINLWIYQSVDFASDVNLSLLKIDVSKLALIDVTNPRMLHQVATGPYLLGPGVHGPDANNINDFMACTFDGRDVWAIMEPRSSQTRSGDIMRLPMALLRS